VSPAPVICHVNLAGGFRGGERQTQLLIDELAKLGWRQRLVVRRGSPLPGRVLERDRIDVREVHSNPVAAAFAAKGAALVHAHEARALYTGLLANLLYGVPFVGTRRVTNPFNNSRLRDWAYRRAACIAVLSTPIDRLVHERYPAVETVVIPSAHADLAVRHRPDPGFRSQYSGRTIVGHIGALVSPHKGQHNLIDVARQWRQSRPDVLFILVGSGKDESLFKQQAAGLDNVVFTGQVSNVDDYLDLFDVFAFPSLMEGLGSTLLDAMCFGLPIVASRVGGIPDIIEDRVNGLLVEPNDPAALAEALGTLLDDQALQQEMHDANLEKATAYSAARMAASYDALYRKILAQAA